MSATTKSTMKPADKPTQKLTKKRKSIDTTTNNNTNTNTTTKADKAKSGKLAHPSRQPKSLQQRKSQVKAAKQLHDSIVTTENESYSEFDSNSSGGEDGGLTRAQLHELQRLAKQTSDNIKQHRQQQKQQTTAPPTKKIKHTAQPTTAEQGVIYLAGIPHGFYENQMRSFFEQFGTVTRLRLARNVKTGSSRHYAFIEFASNDVARIVAENFNNYMMFGKTLHCVYIDHDKVHKNTFIGADKVKSIRIYRREQAERRQTYNKERTAEQQQKREAKLKAKELKRVQQLKDIGIDLDFSGYNADNTADDTPAVTEPVKPIKPTNASKKSAVAVTEPMVDTVDEPMKSRKINKGVKTADSHSTKQKNTDKKPSVKRKQRVVDV